MRAATHQPGDLVVVYDAFGVSDWSSKLAIYIGRLDVKEDMWGQYHHVMVSGRRATVGFWNIYRSS